jgi:hypothetical protein
MAKRTAGVSPKLIRCDRDLSLRARDFRKSSIKPILQCPCGINLHSATIIAMAIAIAKPIPRAFPSLSCMYMRLLSLILTPRFLIFPLTTWGAYRNILGVT